MKQYEYKHFASQMPLALLENELNELGKSGWRVIDIQHSINTSNGRQREFWLMRETHSTGKKK